MHGWIHVGRLDTGYRCSCLGSLDIDFSLPLSAMLKSLLICDECRRWKMQATAPTCDLSAELG